MIDLCISPELAAHGTERAGREWVSEAESEDDLVVSLAGAEASPAEPTGEDLPDLGGREGSVGSAAAPPFGQLCEVQLPKSSKQVAGDIPDTGGYSSCAQLW